MSNLPQKKLSEWLNDHSTLTKIHEKVRELQHLNEVFLQHLETPLNQYCRVANYRDNNLILQAESAAWATRLRYQIPMLKIHLRQQTAFTNLCDIEIQVFPFVTPSDEQRTKLIAPSEADSQSSPSHPTSPQYSYSQFTHQKGEYTTRNKLQQPKISEKSAKLLNETANIISDEVLSNALKRLAKNK